MAGILVDGIKYIGLMNDNTFKSKSLEDNVYFTLRDIFWNANIDDCRRANYFNRILTNNIPFEERDIDFNYVNVLYDYNSVYTQNLYKWIRRMTKYKDNVFKFHDPKTFNDKINMDEYMKFDDWWEQLLDLRKKLEMQLEKHSQWEAEDVERNCNRLTELMDYDDCYPTNN